MYRLVDLLFFLLLVSFVSLVVTVAADPSDTSSSTSGDDDSAMVTDESANGRLLAACFMTADPVDAVAQELSKNGANINVREATNGQTPLMAATLTGKTNVAAFLLEQGADMTIPEKDGYTPVHGAGFQGRADIMRLLAKAGADVKTDFHAGDGYAPLHRACWGVEGRHADTVKTLLELGTDPNLMSKSGKTCAEMTRNPLTRQILEDFQSGKLTFATEEEEESSSDASAGKEEL